MKMKFIPIAIFLGALSLVLSSYETGYTHGSGGDDRTGATGVTSCGGSGCHGTSATTGITVALELDSAGVAVSSYRPGVLYSIKLHGTNTTANNLPKFGFGVTAVKSAGAGTTAASQAGQFGGAPTGARTSFSGTGIIVIEHSSPISATTGSGGNGTTYEVLIPWTAPAAGTGTVKLYSMLNAVDGNGSEGAGDKWNGTSLTVPEFTGPNGISNVSSEFGGLNVYPSLMSGNVHVSFALAASADVTAQIISMNGQIVQTLMSDESLSAGSVNRTYDVAGLAAGVYFVRVKTGNSSVVSKVVKQ